MTKLRNNTLRNSISDHLRKLNLPVSDNRECPTSTSSFNDGSHFAIELSSINNLEILNKAISKVNSEGLFVNRVDECRGGFRLPKSEIQEMLSLCNENNIELVMSCGPRAIYDTGGFSKSKNGARLGYRLRGMENLNYALEDIFRSLELGVKSLLIYDEGLLYILNQLRIAGEIPEDVQFKLSVHSGCANPVTAHLYENLGANSINLIPDLDLPMLASIRSSVSCPLDIFSDTAADAGGFIQTYRIPDIIRVCAPIYIKCGAVSQIHQNHLPNDTELSERVKQLVCVMEIIQRSAPELKQRNDESKNITTI